MEDVREIFRDHIDPFTVYVVEQKFAIGKGLEFFKLYQNKPNYIDCDKRADVFIKRTLNWIGKNIPNICELVKVIMPGYTSVGIVDAIIALSKLFTTQEHQAADENVLDPIIIQEGKVLKKYITKIVNMYKGSYLAPAIIILLKDNDFDRAKELLSECPDGIYLKFIRNSGNDEMYRVINTGAENIKDFINSFSEHCFSTCSKTRYDILLNNEWKNNGIVAEYAPILMKYRANLICDDKKSIHEHLSNDILKFEDILHNDSNLTSNDRQLIKNFLGMSKIYMVFCNDYGGNDIYDALKIAEDTDNEILKAQVYKLSYFFSDQSVEKQDANLEYAYNIFKKYKMEDNAIYCMNNRLVRQFDNDKTIEVKAFMDMIGQATSDIPGLVGMSHLYNNAGVALLMSSEPEMAKENFNTGLSYAKPHERFVQRMGLSCNKLIAKSYYNENVEFSELDKLFKQIFDNMVDNNNLPFIASRYIMNLLIIALRQNVNDAKELLNTYSVIKLVNDGMNENQMGSGQLLLQMKYISRNYPELGLIDQCAFPDKVSPVTGKREQFIKRTGLNPFYFCTWL